MASSVLTIPGIAPLSLTKKVAPSYAEFPCEEKAVGDELSNSSRGQRVQGNNQGQAPQLQSRDGPRASELGTPQSKMDIYAMTQECPPPQGMLVAMPYRAAC